MKLYVVVFFLNLSIHVYIYDLSVFLEGLKELKRLQAEVLGATEKIGEGYV